MGIIGALGGLFGTLFTWLNIKIVRWRAAKIMPSRWKRVLEVVCIMFVYGSLMFWLPFAFRCQDIPAEEVSFEISEISKYYCEEGKFSQTTMLGISSADDAVLTLFSRNREEHIPFVAMVAFLLLYFFSACYAAGSSYASGIVIPMLIVGGCLGRIVGKGMNWWTEGAEWADPGIFALIGAAAFFGGVSRLTVSLTVIMLEISNALEHILVIMFAILVAKWVADTCTHSLYHALLEVKCVPFLDYDSVVPKMECFTVTSIMQSDVKTLKRRQTVREILELLKSCRHGGFPVVSKNGTVSGLVLRQQLSMLLLAQPHDIGSYAEYKMLRDSHWASGADRSAPEVNVDFSDVMDHVMDLSPIMDTSPYIVTSRFSLRLTYNVFRGLGLRHLIVVNSNGKLIGILTRKDLLGQNIADKIDHKLAHGQKEYLQDSDED
eukprot:NODE_1208_length_1425_cov_65.866718_g1197_i0.p1 GENE.NODE_1208_length_1425_cov_65.866718_g1197_i0~~NODE_1208_length_1425_cov_65.866718_g1197_i0.p1  ORF type:complete len:434 (+),score=90.76 NODE_1208_length_1425_cov_65.866718_g1197_i0:61-1362(+)